MTFWLRREGGGGSKLIESVRRMTCVARLSLIEAH